MFDFKSLKENIAETEEWLAQEYSAIRTGRAAPGILDSISVESYGSKMPLKQVASVGVEDARTLRITPWDPSMIKAIEKAISDAQLGLSASADEKGVRAHFPELTAERRTSLIKLAGDKLEQARISVRNARDETWHELQKKEKEGDISEDEKFRYKEEMEKIISAAMEKLEALHENKETEINN